MDHLDQSECSRVRYYILIGELTGSCESFRELLQNFEEMIRGTPELRVTLPYCICLVCVCDLPSWLFESAP